MAKKTKKSKPAEGTGKSRAWIALFLLVAAGVGVYLYAKPAGVVVPELVGKPRAEVESTLRSLGLGAQFQKESTSDPAARPDLVLRQTPEAGAEVPRGTVITLYLPDVPAGITIPDVVGKTRSEAEDMLVRAGLKVKFTESSSNTVQIGKVISQDPSAGPSTLKSGDEVTLIISGGKGEQSVPDLFELTPDFARERLKELGLEMVVAEVAQTGFKEGDAVTILRQEPSAGTKLPVGSRVTVFIPIAAPDFHSAGNSDSHYAPRMEGLTVAQARKLAAEEGVTMELVEESEDSAVITFQDPPPGDPLSGEHKSVVVRTARSAVVPGLTGLSETEARAEVEKAELVVGSVKKSYGPVKGEILGQRPSPGIEVVAGSTVDLVVADPSLAPDSARNADPVPTPAFTPAPWVE